MSNKSRKNKRRRENLRRNPEGHSPHLVITDEYESERILCVRGPVHGPSGYTRICHNLITGLHQAEKNFWIDPLPWAIQPTIELTPSMTKMIKSHLPIKDTFAKNTKGFLCICLPVDLPARPIGPNTWNMTIFETTRIPDDWIKTLSQPQGPGLGSPIKGLILPCRGNLESFQSVNQTKKIIPLAIDYDLFSPGDDKTDLPYRSEFNILTSYHQNQRKNPTFLVKLINEFDSRTTFYVKTFGRGMSSYERELIRKAIGEQIKSDARVVLLYDLISDEEQARLYRSVDLLINVAHGEGWDYPRCEAYSCGTPAIGSMFIGPEDYTIDEFRLINHTRMPCPDIPPYFSPNAQWGELDLVEYIQAIDTVRSETEKYRELALKQREALMKHTGTMKEMAQNVWKTVMG